MACRIVGRISHRAFFTRRGVIRRFPLHGTASRRITARVPPQSAGPIGMVAIAKTLNERGVRTARGWQWHVSSVANLLGAREQLRGEAVGISVLESLACEVPVIAAHRPPFDELIAAEHGMLVDEDNADAVAGAVVQILGSTALARANPNRATSPVEQFQTIPL